MVSRQKLTRAKNSKQSSFSSYVGDHIHLSPVIVPASGRGVNTVWGSISVTMNPLVFCEDQDTDADLKSESGCLMMWEPGAGSPELKAST